MAGGLLLPEPSPLTQWARLTMSTLADVGLRHVVVSPGSRSTPYIVAACNEPRLRLHSAIDERSGAFFALGLARVTGVAAAVLCTSGSAVAHYYPAVIEADSGGVPFLVLSADRPFELQARSAPQTIDQTKIFGERVRSYVETGMPEEDEHALAGLRRALALGMAETSRPGRRGPVHINLRARKPLEPMSDTPGSNGAGLRERVDAALAQPVPTYPSVGVAASADDRAIVDLEALVSAHPRGIIQCGPAPIVDAALAPAVDALARATGYPVYAEAASMLRFVAEASGAARLETLPLLGALLPPEEQPTLVLHVGGAATFARPSSTGPAVLATFSHHGIVDPENDARFALQGNAAPCLRALASRLRSPIVDARWLAALTAKDRAVRAVVERQAPSDAPLQEGRIAASLVASMPASSSLVLGNSLAIRSVELFCVSARGKKLPVFSQRGANGIDGHVAFAAGVAEACREPTALLLGDVSLLHDVGSLLLARECAAPLLLLVLQNGGGRIFDQLPLSGHPLLPPTAWDLIATPRAVGLAAICAGFGVRYERVDALGDLDAGLSAHWQRGGVTLIEAVTDPASSARQEVNALRAAAAASLGAG